MSDYTPEGLGPLIGTLIKDADGFLGFLQLGNLQPISRRRSEWELEAPERRESSRRGSRAPRAYVRPSRSGSGSRSSNRCFSI